MLDSRKCRAHASTSTGESATRPTASIPVFDHGFLYGEGVYETLRTYHRVPFLFDRHMRRLRQSAALMALPVPFSDAELLARDATRRWPRTPALDEAYIRVLLTRGVGELTYNPAATPGADARHHRQAVSRAAGADVHRGHPRVARSACGAIIRRRSTR